MKEKISELKARIEGGLRRACGRISPSRRVAVVVGLCLVFAIINIWSLVSAASGLGRGNDSPAIDIEHIEGIDLSAGQPADSLNTADYERSAE